VADVTRAGRRMREPPNFHRDVNPTYGIREDRHSREGTESQPIVSLPLTVMQQCVSGRTSVRAETGHANAHHARP
jgi:hypothetical protein